MPIIPSLAGYSSLSMSLFHEQQAPNLLSAKFVSPLRHLLDDTCFWDSGSGNGVSWRLREGYLC